MLAFDHDGHLVVASISFFNVGNAVNLDTGEELQASRDVMSPRLARFVMPRVG